MDFRIYGSMTVDKCFLFHRFDIKGCELGRWTNPDTGGKQIIKVLKDNNFEGQHIGLGKTSPHYT